MAPRRGRGAPARRLLDLLFLMESRRSGATARELAAELGAKVRTVYRDLVLLQECDVPLVTDRTGLDARWKLSPGYRQRLAAPLTYLEACALATAEDALRPLARTRLGQAARRAVSRIRGGLPGAIAERIEAGGLVALAGPGPGLEGREAIVDTIEEAIESGRTIEARYRSRARGRETPRRIDPYRLFLDRGVGYLAGHCHDRRAIRTFRLDRFRLVTISDRRFTPPSFDLRDYLAGSFAVTRGPEVDVVIRLAPAVVELLRDRPVHDSQRLLASAEGAELRLRVAIGPELRGWILSLGADAEVVEPADLRRAVALAHAAAAGQYGSGRRLRNAEAAYERDAPGERPRSEG